MDGRANIIKVAIAHKHAYEIGDIDGERFSKPFVGAQKATEAVSKVFREKLTQAIRAI
jgi:hypothetical protein